MNAENGTKRCKPHTNKSNTRYNTRSPPTRTMCSLSSLRFTHRTLNKVQELRQLLRLLESLSTQRNASKELHDEELRQLRQQAENKKQIVQHEQEQYFMVAGIEEKVQQSLQSLLSIYRSLNVDILKSRCFLEMIPSKAELLFVRIHAGFDA